MKTVRIALAMAVTLSIAIPAMAQERKGQGKRGQLSAIGRVMIRMGKLNDTVKGLDLSDEQQEKLKQLREETGPKMGEAFGKLQEILTEEQQNAAKEAAKKAHEAGKEGRDIMLAVQAAVKLTDEQQKKMDALVKEVFMPLSREVTKGIISILTPQQREAVKKAMAPKGGPRRKTAEEKDGE